MTSAKTNAEPPVGVRGHLLRVLGLGFGLAVVIGGTVGSGIMRNPGVVAAGFPNSFGCWRHGSAAALWSA